VLVNRIGGRAALAVAVAALVDAARPRRNRRQAAASTYARPTSGKLAPPVPQVFETTATSPDGSPTKVVATAAHGNEVSGDRAALPGPGAHLELPGTLSIAEGSGHPAGQRSRPTTWVIVSLIAVSFVVAGIGLIVAFPWLFIAGLVAIVASCLAGWAFNIMADTHEGEPGQNRRDA
jgi:hypothetical protein